MDDGAHGRGVRSILHCTVTDQRKKLCDMSASRKLSVAPLKPCSLHTTAASKRGRSGGCACHVGRFDAGLQRARLRYHALKHPARAGNRKGG